MRKSPALLAVFAVVLWGCSSTEEPLSASAKQDPAQELYDAIDAIVPPEPDPAMRDDKEYEAVFMANYKSVVAGRGELIFELCKKFPDSARSASLFDSHWNNTMMAKNDDADIERYLSEINEILGEAVPAELTRHGKYWSAFISSYRDKDDSVAILSHADRFSSEYPKDQRGVTLYNFATVAQGVSVQTMTKALRAIVVKYPRDRQVDRAKAILPLLPHVGKTFELDFQDAITEEKVTMASLSGKVVVIDFWATWCGPCKEAIPYLTGVYSEYKEQGVEFIGVSMDAPIAQGGLDDMRSFVSEYGVEWPQYYVGEELDYPAKYGVSMLPTMFILDKKGVIRSVDGYSVLLRTLDALLDE